MSDISLSNDYDAKYNLILQFLNGILSNIDKEPINKLEEFVNVSRMDLLNPVHRTTWNNMQNEIAQYYNLKLLTFKEDTKNFIIVCLQEMLRDICYNLSKHSNPDSKTVQITYSIVKSV